MPGGGGEDLLVGGQAGEHGNDLALDVLQLQDLGEFPELGSGGAANHGRVIGAQRAEVPAPGGQAPMSTG